MRDVTVRSVIRASRPLAALSVVMAALVVVSVLGLLLDPRLLGGQPIWAKPLKFSVSLALYGATLAWMISSITAPAALRWARRAGAVVAVASIIEMVVIVGQVVRGRASHFDQATAFDAWLWRTMGGAITVLWLATAVIAVMLLRENTLPPALGRAIRLGLLVALIGMAAAFLMVVPTAAQLTVPHTPVSGAHAVGVPDGGPGLPFLGWSTTGGDLRIGHFVGLHALQGLPLLALALRALAGRFPVLAPERVRARLVTVGGAAWIGLVALLEVQALRAQPLLDPDVVTLGAAAVLVVGTVAAGVVVLRTTPRPVADRPEEVAV